MKIIILFLFIIISIFSFGQDAKDLMQGGLKRKQVTNYWDRDSTMIRSRGFYNVSGFSGIGQKTGKWTTWYKNGEVEQSSSYVNGKLHGKVTQLYPTGKVKNVGYFKYGIQDSIFASYYENEQVKEQGEFALLPDSILFQPHKYWNILSYIKPQKIGKWNYFHENGNPLMTVEFKPKDTTEYLVSYWDNENKQTVLAGNGVIKEQYHSKKPKSEKHYKNGLLNGKYTEWNANGTVRVEGHYKNGKKDGEWKLWNFVAHTLYQVTNYKEGEKDGLFMEYNPNEILVIKGVYDDGEKNGKWEYYFNNGSKDMIGSFANGKQQGHWDYWHPNGKLYYEGNYENDKKEGEWNFYYKTGDKWRTGNYHLNLKEDLWTNWYENGQEAFEGKFNAGKEQGVWTSWYENGIMKDRGSYDNGKMVADWKGWYPNDEKRYEGTYTNDLKDGKWMYWTSKGKLKDEGHFAALKKPKKKNTIIIDTNTPEVQSYKHGKWISYSEKDGKLVSEGSYSYGEQDGLWKFYYPGGKIVSVENSFKNGKLDGTSKTFTRRGLPQTVINYKNGKKHGEMKIYDRKGKKVISNKLYKNGEFKKNL